MRLKLRLRVQKERQALRRNVEVYESAGKRLEENIATMTERAHAAMDLHVAAALSVLDYLNSMASAAKARLRQCLHALDKREDDLDVLIRANASTALALRAALLQPQQHVVIETRVVGLFKLRIAGFAQYVLGAQPVLDASIQFAHVVTHALDASTLQLPHVGVVRIPLHNTIRVRLCDAVGAAIPVNEFRLLLASKRTAISVTVTDDYEYRVAFTLFVPAQQLGIDICAELFADELECAAWTLTPLQPGPYVQKRRTDDAPLQHTLLPLRESTVLGATRLASVPAAAFAQALQKLQTFAAWYGFACTFDQRPIHAAELRLATLRPNGRMHDITLYVSSCRDKVLFETIQTDSLHKFICTVLAAPDLRAAWDAAPNALLHFQMRDYYDDVLDPRELSLLRDGPFTHLAEFLQITCRPVVQQACFNSVFRTAWIAMFTRALLATRVLNVAGACMACMALHRLGEPMIYTSLQNNYDHDELWLLPLVKLHCK